MNYRGRPRPHPELRRSGCGRDLATRHVVAALANRHANVVPRHCEPVACDLMTRQELYDLDECEAALKRVERRSSVSRFAR